jgi:hypothetical protein
MHPDQLDAKCAPGLEPGFSEVKTIAPLGMSGGPFPSGFIRGTLCFI